MAGMDYYGGGYTSQGTASVSTDVIIWPSWVQGPFGCLLLNGTETIGGADIGTANENYTVQGGFMDTGTAWQTWTVRVAPVAPETPEVRQAREAQHAEWVTQHAKQVEESKAAEARAERLLVEHLSLAQRAAYEKGRFFEVVAAKSRYRIYHDGGVRRLGEDGREVASYCIHPDEAIPVGDLALAKKLLLETDEAAFLRTANATALVRM